MPINRDIDALEFDDSLWLQAQQRATPLLAASLFDPQAYLDPVLSMVQDDKAYLDQLAARLDGLLPPGADDARALISDFKSSSWVYHCNAIAAAFTLGVAVGLKLQKGA
jgi:hypothetical protein